MRYTVTLLFISVLFINSCIEPYEVRSIDYDRALVVEGRLTNEKKVHYVKLSYTRPVDVNEGTPITGAQVWVEDSGGGRIEFFETEKGLYETEAEIAGVPGESYQLFFTTSDDKKYQSASQELLVSPPIDSIYDVYKERVNENTNKIRKGIQFFIDSHGETGLTQHYKYEFEETYEVRAPYPSLYDFSPNPDTVVTKKEEVSPCYVSTKSTSINLATTANLTKNYLSEVPIRFLTSETDHLKYAYSILVKQFAISASAFTYYREIVANNEDNGSLFDKQLGTVVGNVSCIDEPEETVLGFFEVSGVSEMRSFFKATELDSRFPFPGHQFPCSPPEQFAYLKSIDSLEYYAEGKQFGIITAEYNDGEFRSTLGPKYCTDCRFRGPAKKPEFWIY